MNAFCPSVSDTPGKPGTPEIADFDKDFVQLKWTAPESDGGSPITGYVIEKKDKYSPDWTPCGETGPECQGTVKDLIEGQEYEFRVVPVNKGGRGEPSDSTGKHLARPKNREFCRDQMNLHGRNHGESLSNVLLFRSRSQDRPDVGYQDQGWKELGTRSSSRWRACADHEIRYGRQLLGRVATLHHPPLSAQSQDLFARSKERGQWGTSAGTEPNLPSFPRFQTSEVR